MRVPLLDLSEQYRQLAGPIREKMDSIFSTQRFILGPAVAEFEKQIAHFLEAPHAIGVSSGTDALLIALMALEIGPADAVIVPSYSFFATAGCVVRVGATPIFVDIDPITYNLSVPALKEFVETKCKVSDGNLLARTQENQWKRVRAVVPVHLFGLCCDMDPLLKIAGRYHLEVIEDAAQAIGAEYRSGNGAVCRAGTMGAIGCFSFYPSKNLGAAGDAGLVVARDDTMAGRLRIYRQHGMEPRYFHHVVGGNFRLDEIQAAILEVKLPYLNKWAAARRDAADFYNSEFKRAGLDARVSLPAEPYRDSGLTNHHVYHQYVIRSADRDALREHLTRREIGTEVYYPLGLHDQKCFQYLGYQSADLPETARAARETLALPIWPEISREAQRYVVDGIAEFFR